MARSTNTWKHAVVGVLGSALIRFLRWSWRVTEEPGPVPEQLRAARSRGDPGCVYLFWHSRSLIAAATRDGAGISVLVSQHSDGEYMARVIRRLGFTAVRGSTTRGGLRALADLVGRLRAGEDIVVTPDGPRGPRLAVQVGCILAASMSGARLVPMACDARRSKRFASWDRFMLPAPFTRVHVRFGEPIDVPPRLAGAAAEEWRRRIEEVMHAESAAAAAALGLVPETADVDPRGQARRTLPNL